MDNKQKRLIVLIAGLAALLVVCIVAAVMITAANWGDDVTGTTGSAEGTAQTDDVLDTTAPDDSTGASVADTTEPVEGTGNTEPSQSGTQGGSQGGSQTSGGNSGSNSAGNDQPTQAEEEEEKTPTIGVDDGNTPTGENENNVVIDFDDLLEAANNGKKNEG